MKLLSTIAFALTVALITVVMTIRETNRREVAAFIADVDGAERLLTFRFKPNAAQVPLWHPDDIEHLRHLEGVARVEWQSGWSLTQGPFTQYVVPVVTASPGLLALITSGPAAGRLFTEADNDQHLAVIGADLAERLYGEASANDYLGRHIELEGQRYEVIGVVEGLDAVYRAAHSPVDVTGTGRYNVNDVYVQVSQAHKVPQVLRALQRYLDSRPNLAMLEAVTLREFVMGGVTQERVAFLREADQLLWFLVVLVCGFAVLNLYNVTAIASHSNIERWALLRVLGSSRKALLLYEALLGNTALFMAIGLGVAAGLFAGPRYGGTVTLEVATWSLTLGLMALLIGTLPALLRAIPLHPAPALRSGATFRRGGRVATAGSAVVVTLALTLIMTAGGVYVTGEATLRQQIEGIGPQLAQFRPDRSSLLPVASLAPSDVARIRQQFPNAKLTFVQRIGAEAVSPNGSMPVQLLRADGGYPEVSGSRLADGTWQEDGVVIGAAVAEKLFPEGRAVGSTIRLPGVTPTMQEIRVVGVAMAPSTDRLESLQLQPDAIWLPSALVADARAPGARVYLDLGSLREDEVVALTEALNALHPDRAPYEPVVLSQSYQNYLMALTMQRRRFQLAASVLVPLATVALVMMAVTSAQARRYRRALERVLGASWQDRFMRELRAGVGVLLLVCLIATLLSAALLWLWSTVAAQAFAFPTAWAAAAVGAVIAIGMPVTLMQVRRSLDRSPSADLGAE